MMNTPHPENTPHPPQLRRGAGAIEPDPTTAPTWGGARAQRFTRLVLETYGTTCWLCGFNGATTTDHVIPRSKGGAVYHLDNAAPAHARCNYARGNRDATDHSLIVEDGTSFFRN